MPMSTLNVLHNSIAMHSSLKKTPSKAVTLPLGRGHGFSTYSPLGFTMYPGSSEHSSLSDPQACGSHLDRSTNPAVRVFSGQYALRSRRGIADILDHPSLE